MPSRRHDLSLKHITIHGHEVGYRMAGSGPAVVFIHGLAGSSTTWNQVMPALAENFTVIAPDLLGHGESAKPRGDYSLGAYASGVRDLMVALGIEQATFVGHSLGGGVALQFAYQFPERCDRLVLVASGGLGKEVNSLLRAVSLPGSELVMPVLLSSQMHTVLTAVTGWFARRGLRFGATTQEHWRSYAGLSETGGRVAFIHTVRSVIDPFGQRVSARDRLYLASEVPTLIMWGDKDRIIPVDHAHAAHELIPGSTLVVLPGVGHFLPTDAAEAFIDTFEAFVAEHPPANPTEAEFRALLLEHTASALEQEPA
jgi:pimeloyl-ACP methyl ester carboxylesterase